MKQEKKSHKVNSREHLKELTSGKYKYFTLEFEGHNIQRDGMTILVSESYRIPNKLMKYWQDARRHKGEEAKEFYKLGKHWMDLYRLCQEIRN